MLMRDELDLPSLIGKSALEAVKIAGWCGYNVDVVKADSKTELKEYRVWLELEDNLVKDAYYQKTK